MRRPGSAMPNDNNICVQRFEIFSGILKRFAFLEGRSFSGKIDHIRAQTLSSQFEADAGAGGRFDEEVYNGFPAECGNFLDGALTDSLESARGIQNSNDLFRRKRLNIEEMFPIPRHSYGLMRRTESASALSSRKLTSTRSSKLVGTSLPTKSALIGSSRLPRSIRTAS